MNDVKEMIREYAHLQHKTEIYQAHGQAVPANITLRMNGLLAWGRAHIHPNSFHLAIQEVNATVANLHMQRGSGEQEFREGTKKELLDRAVGKVTQGMLGQAKLTPNQLKAIVKHEPLRARIAPKQQSQAQRDAEIRAATKQFDPRGIGFGEKEFRKRMDELTDAESNPQEFARLVHKYKGDMDGARQAVKAWKSTRLAIGLDQRARERQEIRGYKDKNPVLKEVPDSEHRKATLATAFLADASDQADRGDYENLNDLREEIPQRLLQEDSSRGQVARAFEAVEARGETV
jgi:hypothetical protein